MLNAENQGKSKKKYRWHCAVKDEQGNSRFWSVEEYDDETVRKLIFEKNWKVLAVTRVKDDVEKEAEEPSAGKASGIAAMVSIVAVIVSVFVPLSAAIFLVLAAVTAAVVEIIMGGVTFGFFALILSVVRIYFLWISFTKVLANL